MHKESRPPAGLASLWGMEASRGRGPQARWSVPEVAAAGLALADTEGLGAVTLAAVARALGLTTSALYRYVDTKEVLVELIADAAFEDPPVLPDGDWREAARTWALALGEVYATHPWLTDVPPAGPPRRPSAYRWMAALVEAVPEAGGTSPLRLALMLDALVRGYAPLRSDVATPPEWLGAAVGERFPVLAAGMERDWADVGEELEEAVDTLLAGVAGRRG